MPLAAVAGSIIGAVGGAGAAATIGAAAIGAGSKIYAANRASSANKAALAAQNAGNQQAIQAQQDNFNRVVGLNQPFINGGNAAYNQLLGRLGVQGYGAPQVRYQANPQGSGAGQQPFSATSGKATGGFAGTSPAYGGNAGQTNMSNPAYFSGGGTPTGAPYDPAMDAFPMSPGSVGTGGLPMSQIGGNAMSGGYNPAPTPDWNAYLTQYPDVAAQAAREGRDPVEYAQAHYQAFGQNEGRNLPMTQPAGQDVQTGGQPDAVAQPMVQERTDLMTSDRPNFGDRPAVPELQNYVRPDMGQGPDVGFYLDPTKFTADPGYQFRQKEALGGVNAYSAAKGLLRSGGAVKALQDRASDLASQEYNNWFNRQFQQYNAARNAFQYNAGRSDSNFQNDRAYGTGLWDYNVNRNDANYSADRARSDRNFETDRSYQTNRYDNQTNNLFNVANVGVRAAGNVAGVSSDYANNASNIYAANGYNAANAATANGSNSVQLIGGLAQTGADLFSRWGGSSKPSTYTSDLGSVNLGQVSNPFGSYGTFKY